VEAGWEVRLLEDVQAAAGPPDRRDQLGTGRAAGQVGLDVEPLTAVDVAGLVGGELLLVGMVGHSGYSWRERLANTVTPGRDDRVL
jgi:hypothetical protein